MKKTKTKKEHQYRTFSPHKPLQESRSWTPARGSEKIDILF